MRTSSLEKSLYSHNTHPSETMYNLLLVYEALIFLLYHHYVQKS
jgi:hypothetical protein